MSSTLKIGYYDCFGDIAEHTYAAVTTSDGTTQWYDCWGGHSGSNDNWPAKFFWKKDYWSRATETGERELSVDKHWVDGIASWGTYKPQDIKKSHAAIAYSINGVCHQACNRVIFPTKNHDWGFVNYPNSFNISFNLYGYYGGGKRGYRDKQEQQLLYAFRNVRGTHNDGFQAGLSIPSIAQILQQHLNDKPTKDQMREAIASRYELEKTDLRIDSLIEKQEKMYKQKEDYDRDLLSGNLKLKKEAVAIIGDLGKQLEKIAKEVLQDTPLYKELNLSSDNIDIPFVSEDMMPDMGYFQDLGKEVKY